MIGSGLRAVLMKVAGLGLRVEDVGRELSVMRPRLAKLVSGAHHL
jgi:diphthamide synthase (EF-2-diphthine--ammonia ligase)